jgi:hypothetical protein
LSLEVLAEAARPILASHRMAEAAPTAGQVTSLCVKDSLPAVLLHVTESHLSRVRTCLSEGALGPARRHFYAPKAGLEDVLLPLSLVGSSTTFADLQRKLAASFLSRYVMRLYYADRMVTGVEQLVTELSGPPSVGRVYRLQCFPRDLEGTLTKLLPLDVQLHPKKFTHLLTLVAVPLQTEKADAVKPATVFLTAVVPAACFFNNAVPLAAPDLGNGPAKKPRNDAEEVVSRAYHKLAEAQERLSLQFAGLRCIDVGASPGGERRYLLDLATVEASVLVLSILIMPSSRGFSVWHVHP